MSHVLLQVHRRLWILFSKGKINDCMASFNQRFANIVANSSRKHIDDNMRCFQRFNKEVSILFYRENIHSFNQRCRHTYVDSCNLMSIICKSVDDILTNKATAKCDDQFACSTPQRCDTARSTWEWYDFAYVSRSANQLTTRSTPKPKPP